LISKSSFRRYYKKQDELITAFEGVNNMAYSDGDNSEAAKRLLKKAAILAKISFFMNLVSGRSISDFRGFVSVILRSIFIQ